MLFQINESVAEKFSSGSATAQDVEAIEYLLRGAAEGSHRVSGARAVLRCLSGSNLLGHRAKKTLERALGRIAQEGHLTYRLKTIGEVVSTAATDPSVRFSGTQRIITFPLQWFDASSRIRPVTLIGENLSDVEIFRIIGEVGTLLDGCGYLPMAFTASNGGGSTTGIVLDHLASQNHVCLCIVDSDRLSPTSDLGTTAKGVAKFKNPIDYPLVGVCLASTTLSGQRQP